MNKVKKISIYYIFFVSLLWTFMVDIPIYQQVIFFLIQSIILYLLFCTEFKNKFYCLLSIILILLFITGFSSGFLRCINFFSTFWPSVIFIPFLIIIYLYGQVKAINKLILIIIALIFLVLFRNSINIYTLINLFPHHKVRWFALEALILKIFVFAYLPLLLNNLTNKNIRFTFKFKCSFKMLLYFLVLILIHQTLFFAMKRQIYIPKVYNLREIILYFGAPLLTTSLCEEILYRGFLYNSLNAITKTKQAAIIIASVIFGLFHIQFGLIPVLFLIITGFVFSKMYLETDSLMYPIIFHTFLNLYL